LVTELSLQDQHEFVGIFWNRRDRFSHRTKHRKFSGNQSGVGESGEEFENGMKKAASY